MTETSFVTASGRTPLTRDRLLRGAMTLADDQGIGALTMRTLARELGVKPMALYHHVANKEEILDGIVDAVFGEIELPVPGGEWRAEMRRRAVSARLVLKRHPWSIELLQSRTSPGPSTLRHHDSMIGTLRAAGFSVEMTAHAYALIDSYVYGFALSEASLPINGPETVAEVAGEMMKFFPAQEFPHLYEFTVEHVLKPDYNFAREFEFGLEVVLDGLQRKVSSKP